MFAFNRKNDSLTHRLSDRLKTTSVGLGLLRLQVDAGMTDDARNTLAALQDDFQLLLHGLEGEMEDQPAPTSTPARELPKLCIAEEDHEPFASTPTNEFTDMCCGV